MPELKIAIIGAGPAGCMLARLLHLAGISVTIFEGEANLDFRSQGGTLDLHADTGIAAMKKAGLYDQFLNHARFDGEAFQITDKKLNKYINFGGTTKDSSRGRPEIDRPKLREILVNSLPDGCVRWGSRLRSVDENLRLQFEHGPEDGFDLLVGADGAFSKVRPLLSSTEPFYSGISGHSLSIPNAKENHLKIYELINRGSLFAFSEARAVIGQQMGDGSINTSVWQRDSEEKHARKLDSIEASVVKKQYQEALVDWSTQLQDLVLQGNDDSLIYRPLYMLPIGHSWKHRPGVTLVGDAAHLMTPFAGEGVNLALADTMKLADAIVKANKLRTESSDNLTLLSKQVDEFERDMFRRATKVQTLTYNMMHALFFLVAPLHVRVRTFVLTAVADETPSLIYPLVALACYIYFYALSFFY